MIKRAFKHNIYETHNSTNKIKSFNKVIPRFDCQLNNRNKYYFLLLAYNLLNLIYKEYLHIFIVPLNYNYGS